MSQPVEFPEVVEFLSDMQIKKSLMGYDREDVLSKMQQLNRLYQNRTRKLADEIERLKSDQAIEIEKVTEEANEKSDRARLAYETMRIETEQGFDARLDAEKDMLLQQFEAEKRMLWSKFADEKIQLKAEIEKQSDARIKELEDEIASLKNALAEKTAALEKERNDFSAEKERLSEQRASLRILSEELTRISDSAARLQKKASQMAAGKIPQAEDNQR